MTEDESQNAGLEVRRIARHRLHQVHLGEAAFACTETLFVIGGSKGIQCEVWPWRRSFTALCGQPGELTAHRSFGLRTLGPAAVNSELQDEFQQFLDADVTAGQRCVHVVVDGPDSVGRAHAGQCDESPFSATQPGPCPHLAEHEISAGRLVGR